jgi:outer membrane protein TolC
VAALLSAAGCRGYFSEQRFMTVDVPPERLRNIEPLDLEEMSRKQEAEGEAPGPTPTPLPPEKVSLTLEECRATALEHNLTLNVELRNPAIAETAIAEAEAAFEPSLFGNASYSHVEQPTATALNAAKSKTLIGDLGVHFPLRTGGSITFDVAANRFETTDVFATLNPAYGSGLSVSVSQPLLRDAGVRTNTHTIRIARYEGQRVEARTKLEVIRVIAAVDRVYWRLYASRRELQVRKNEHDLAVAQLERARRRVAAGAIAEVEILRAEAGVAERLEAIIIADNRVRDRERDLKRILNAPGLDIESPTVVVPATEPNPMHFDLDLRRLIGAALANRMEMLEIELQVAQDESTIAFQRNQALPLLALDYTYGLSGLGDTPGDAFDLMLEGDFDTHRAGLQLSVPLGNKAARSRVRRAILTRLQRLATKERRSALIRQEVANAVDQLEATWQRILASRQSTVLAARTAQAEERQFEIGLRTSTDVLEAQTRLADAQSAEIRALVEYQIALVDLAFATGHLLGEARVYWAPIAPATG